MANICNTYQLKWRWQHIGATQINHVSYTSRPFVRVIVEQHESGGGRTKRTRSETIWSLNHNVTVNTRKCSRYQFIIHLWITDSFQISPTTMRRPGTDLIDVHFREANWPRSRISRFAICFVIFICTRQKQSLSKVIWNAGVRSQQQYYNGDEARMRILCSTELCTI